MKKICAILLIFLPLLVAAKKQGHELIDSLQQELSRAGEDTNKAKILLSLTQHYVGDNPDEGIKYATQALELSEAQGWKKGAAKAKLLIGLCHNSKSDFPGALEYLFQALKTFEETGDKDNLASCLSNIGLVYGNQTDWKKALEYDLKALKMHEELGNKGRIGVTLGNIGNAYMATNDLAKALEYDLKALHLYEELDDKGGISRNLGNIGGIYQEMGNYEKALEYDFRALKLFEEQGDKRGTAINLGNIGEVYLMMVQNPKNKNKAENSVHLREAITYMRKGADMCREIGFLDGIQEFLVKLSDAYALSGDYKNGMETYKTYTAIRDSVFNTDNNVKIAGLESKRALDLKDKQIEIDKLAVAKKRNERVFYIAGIGFLLFVTGIMWKNNISQKKSNTLLEKSNTLLSTQKQRTEDLLLNILPAEVAEELKENGTAHARQFDHVTVLFTDFVNFTEAGIRMTPQQLIGELHTCFKTFDNILGKYNIEKIKTVGDAYLAVSGLPAPNPAHATDVVAAAIEIQNFMLQRRKQFGDNTFGMRVGIHSGGVVAGIVGVKKFAYDIWGDTVNLAARMEQSSEEGKINISEATYGLVKDKYTCEYRGEIEAKNKGAVKMYFVTG